MKHRRLDCEERRVILARRARFVAAALAGIGGCNPPPPGAEPPASVVNIEAPERAPRAEGEAGSAGDHGHLDPEAELEANADAGAGPGALPPRARAPDRDGDGVPDDDDQCPDAPGSRDPASDRLGCPRSRPMVCLSEL